MRTTRVAVIVVARAGSTRLPGKMLEAFGGGTVLSCALTRCQQITRADEIILATTSAIADDALAAEATRVGIRVVRGSESDVVGRMELAVRGLDQTCDVIVRACADNPLFMPMIVDSAIDELLESGCDMLTPFEHATLPFGYGFAVLTRECLARIDSGAKEPAYREHVENYCLEHPGEFKVRYQVAPDGLAWPELCLSLDYASDLERLRRVEAKLTAHSIENQPAALIEDLRSARVWIEGRDLGEPDQYDLVLLADERPGVRANRGVLCVDRFESGGQELYGLRYCGILAKGFPKGPVYLDDHSGSDDTPVEFLSRSAHNALPFLLAAPARSIAATEFAAPPIEKRVEGKERRGFSAACEESFPASVVLDHAEHSADLLEALLNELEEHEGTELFLPQGTQRELARAIERLGAERVREGSPEADPFRVLNVSADGQLEIPGANSESQDLSITTFWQSSEARAARAKLLNEDVA